MRCGSSSTEVRSATQHMEMAASMQGHIMYRRGGLHLRLGLVIANAWGVLTSNHTPRFPKAGRRCWTLHPQGPSPLMAARPLQLDFAVTGRASTTEMPRASKLRCLSEIEGTSNAGMKMPPESVSTSIEGQGAFGSEDIMWTTISSIFSSRGALY